MNRHDYHWQNVQKPVLAAAVIYVAIALEDVAAPTSTLPWLALLGGMLICLFLFTTQVLSKIEEMNNQITITQNDYQRLMALIALSSERNHMPAVTDQLVESLGRAKRLTQKDIAKTVITMNSRVKLKDLRSRREVEITITYPTDAEPRERRVSVFSEIGMALLGRKENDIVSWKIPNGVGQFQVGKVLYQPEAAGDYFL